MKHKFLSYIQLHIQTHEAASQNPGIKPLMYKQLSSQGHARLKAILAASIPVHNGGGGGAAAVDDDDAKVDTDTKVDSDTKVLHDKVNEGKDDDEVDRVQAVLSHPPNKGDLRRVV